MSVTVQALEEDVADDVATALAEAGVYLVAVGDGGVAVTPAIRKGLRIGVSKAGYHLANPLVLADADLAHVTPFAVQYVLVWGRIYALRQALLHWHRATQKHRDQPLEPTPMAGGWLVEERRAVRDYLADLEASVREPYREPADPMVVAGGVGHDPCRPGADAVLPLRCGPRGGWGWGGTC